MTDAGHVSFWSHALTALSHDSRRGVLPVLSTTEGSEQLYPFGKCQVVLRRIRKQANELHLIDLCSMSPPINSPEPKPINKVKWKK